MKKMLMLAVCTLPLIVKAQSGHFQLTGKLQNIIAPAKIYLIYVPDHSRVIDSATVVNGRFEFSSTIKEPHQSKLILCQHGKSIKNDGTDDAFSLYLDTGKLEVYSADSITNAQIKGSGINIAYSKLKLMLKHVDAQSNALNRQYRQVSPETRNSNKFQDFFRKKDDEIEKEKKGVLLAYIKSDTQTLVSLNSLIDYAGESPDINIKEIKPLFENLSVRVRESNSGKQYAAYLLPLERTAIGNIVPDFTLPDTSGKNVILSYYRGKYVLIDFWASWCGSCRDENPNLVKAYHKFHHNNFEIISISLDKPNGKSNWLKAIHADGLSWTQLADLKGWKNQVAVLYGIDFIPQNILIDPNGIIVAKNLRGDELAMKLSAVFSFTK